MMSHDPAQLIQRGPRAKGTLDYLQFDISNRASAATLNKPMFHFGPRRSAPSTALWLIGALKTAARRHHWFIVTALAATACNSSPSSAENVSAALPSVQMALGAARSAPKISQTSAADSRCPEGMVSVKSFCIDRYEAHLVEADSPQTIHPPYRRPSSGKRYRAASTPGVIPQGYISRREAAEACHNAGKRLCSANEWQEACKGPFGNQYPYGPLEIGGQCNTGKPHLPSRLFGRDASLNTEAYFNNPRLNQEPGFLAKSGEYAGCVGQYGVFDLMGNLHEWVSDPVDGALPKKIPIPYGAQHMGRRGNGVFLGGYFSSNGEHGRGCEYVTTHHSPDYHDYSTGFRCCADVPSPGTPHS
jgi:formylglycine-generating enzyme